MNAEFLNTPSNWVDTLDYNSPPWQWQALAADGRWYFLNDGGGPGGVVVGVARADEEEGALTEDVLVEWEVIEAGPDSSSYDFHFHLDGVGELFVAPHNGTSGSATIPSGTTFGAYWVEQNSGRMYSGTIAVRFSAASSEPDFNCECDDDYPNATLAELRTRVISRTGFSAPPAAAVTATLAQLRTRVTARLGFITQIAAQTGMQLSAFRSYLMSRLGFAAQIASPPPGMNVLLDALVNEAQQLVWRRYAYAGYSASVPALLVNPTDACTLDSQAIQLFALAAGKDHYGQADAKRISDQAETYLKELIARSPPNLTAQLNQDINSAIQTIWRRYAYGQYNAAAPAQLTGDTDVCTVDAQAVELLATGLAKGYYGQTDAKVALDQYETYIRELHERSPPNLIAIVNDAIASAQQQLFRRYPALNTERFYAWTMEPGKRFYGIKDSEDDCPKKLDAYSVKWVGVQDLNGQWYPLLPGINPVLYSDIEQTGYPQRYEIRSCIEVYPAPREAYKLRVKGNFGLLPLTEDADTTTLDPELVFLWATGLVKAHYGQKDSATYFEQARGYLGGIVAGSHHTRRYVPGKPEPQPYIEPRMEKWDYEP